MLVVGKDLSEPHGACLHEIVPFTMASTRRRPVSETVLLVHRLDETGKSCEVHQAAEQFSVNRTDRYIVNADASRLE